MKVCFSSVTSYSLFMSCILAQKEYKDDTKTLIISNLLEDFELIYKRLKMVNLFDNIYIIDEEDSSIEYKITKILNEGVDILHFYTFGSKYCKEIYKQFNGKIILTEEGISTYVIEEINYVDNLDKISEIWTNVPELYCGEKFKEKVKKINIEKIIEDDKLVKSVCDSLNYIYDYTYYSDNNENYIYFDQYINRDLMIDEIELFKKINEYLYHYKIKVKVHPLYVHREKYINKDVDFVSIKENIPWELKILNDIVNSNVTKNYIFMSPYSAALFESKLLYKDEIQCKIILLSNIFNINSKQFDKFKLLFKEKYCNSIFQPQTFSELNKILSRQCNKEVLKETNELLVLEKDEWNYVKNVLQDKLEMYSLDTWSYRIRFAYLRSMILIKGEKRLIIWGASKGGNAAVLIIKRIMPEANIIGYVDTFKKGVFDGLPIYEPSKLEKMHVNYICIATYPGKEYAKQFLDKNGYKENYDYMYVL